MATLKKGENVVTPFDDSKKRVVHIIQLLRGATQGMQKPASDLIVQSFGKDPFLILIGCLLSLRTKDTISYPASVRLFSYGKNPSEILALPLSKIESLIYPVGFYRRKARNIHTVCLELLAKHSGTVPQSEAELLLLPGVGRKTANLVLGQAFDIPALCVDVHVHRLSNRLGIVTTTTVEQTEECLKKVVPQEYWIEYNRLLVMWGQNLCVPISPFCSRCVLRAICPQKGIVRAR